MFAIVAIGAVVAIAVAVFVVIAMLADRPVKAFIVAHAVTYALISIYIYVLNRLIKRKEESRVVVQ